MKLPEMKIPKSFKLFATTINVVFDNKRMNIEGLLGLSEIMKSSISLTSELNGTKVENEIMIDTYYHEKIHMILDFMSEHELSKNEKFVQLFASLLRQSDETVKY